MLLDWFQHAAGQSDATWKFVVLHHVPFTSSWHDDVPEVRLDFAALGTDAVFSGHNHVYEQLALDGVQSVISGLGGVQ